MQNAKDSFYEMLRSRLEVLNPERTIVIRGITRPGILVDENEATSVSALPDCFHLQWGDVASRPDHALALVTMRCEIRYETAGNSWNGGLDRGRALSAMDGELLAVINLSPQNAAKRDYTPLQMGGSAVQLQTRIWWSDVNFAKATTSADRLQRIASVEVMSLQEPGEK